MAPNDDPRTSWSDTPPVDDAPASSVEVVRSEEQLHVGTVSTPHTRLRIRRVIISEEQTITVTVRREELRIDEESDSGGRAAASDDAGDLTLLLHEEQIVVTKKIVPVERIRIAKRAVVVDPPVTVDLRRDQVRVDPGR